jgi:hypothetical protein
MVRLLAEPADLPLSPPSQFLPPLPPHIRPEDACDKSGSNLCGQRALGDFLANYAAPVGWICTLVASVLAFGQVRPPTLRFRPVRRAAPAGGLPAARRWAQTACCAPFPHGGES